MAFCSPWGSQRVGHDLATKQQQYIVMLGFLGGSVVKNLLAVKETCRRSGFNPWFRKIPWRRKWQPTPVFLSEKSHGQRNLVGYSPWDCKESYTTEHAHTHMIQ